MSPAQVVDQHVERHWGYAVIYDDLGFCGCGYPEAAMWLVRDVLRMCPLFDHREEFKARFPDRGVQMLVLYMLDDADLIEHGGNVAGSWLTEKGERFLALLNTLTSGDDVDALSNVGYSCSECPYRMETP